MPGTRKRKGGLKLPSVSDLKNIASNVKDLVKENQVLSRALSTAGYDTAGDVVKSLGYGKRKPKPAKAGKPKVGRKGAGFMDFLRGVAQIPGNVIMGTAAGLNQGIGNLGGKKRRAPAKRRGGMSLTGNTVRPFVML